MIITLKDGSKREVQEGISVIDLAKEISEGLARVATAGRVDGKVVDLRYNLNKDCNVEILTWWRWKKSILAYDISHNGTSYQEII